MNIPQNVNSSQIIEEDSAKIVKNVVLQTPISTHINNLTLYKKTQSNFYKQINMLSQPSTNSYYKNYSSMMSVNNSYTKNCKNCDN